MRLTQKTNLRKMVSRLMLRRIGNILCTSFLNLQGRRFYGTKSSKPLRILFCGSDDFSSVSLRALHAEHERDPQLIKSIDVLCRPGKPSGRALKNIREVPTKAVAQELSLPIHERDTFTGWDLPKLQGEDINLIIAVSFGLFVPRRILEAAEYGGLNVHPSLLPYFRGPAPLQHTILAGAEKTGVTLQTLDNKSFDHGIILSQTPPLSIPNWRHCTYKDLLDFISPKAASLLVQGLRDLVFIPPLIDIGLSTTKHVYPQNYKIENHATKITPKDGELHLLDCDANQIYRQYRAIGRLWSNIWVDAKTRKRLVFEDITLVDMSQVISNWIELWISKFSESGATNKEEVDATAIRFIVPSKIITGPPRPLLYIEDGDTIIFNTKSCAVRIGSITVEGQSKKAASKALRSIYREKAWRLISVPTLDKKQIPSLLVKPVQVDAMQKDDHGWILSEAPNKGQV